MAKCQPLNRHSPDGVTFCTVGKLCENAGRFIVNASEKLGLVIHYSTNGLDSACGRSSQTLASTAVAEQVSCKSCQRSLAKPEAATAVRKSPSLAELRKSAKAAVEPVAVAAAVAAQGTPAPKAVTKPASKPAGKTVQTPARAGGFSAKAEWAARLAEQQGQSRLPRGKGRQRHV